MADRFIHLRNAAGDTQRIVKGTLATKTVVADWQARGYREYTPESPYDAASAVKTAKREPTREKTDD